MKVGYVASLIAAKIEHFGALCPWYCNILSICLRLFLRLKKNKDILW